ncbi:hypothetical protein ACTD5D_09045 [Nocardia takedensis]|uniref:hypothetical protein n=1 Tax=Nocardia takedensis TaxID=259390 RepID=UPI0012F679E7|nr:hypothetical protein [Nocardia takedensis]
MPEVVEHLERHHPDGFWVRIQLGRDARERDYAARVFLGTWTHVPDRADGPPQLIARTNTDIGEPVVIACLPEDSIRSVVEQFKSGESYAVLLSFVDVQQGYDWTWVSGIARGAKSANDYPAASLEDQGLTLDSTMRELKDASIAGRRESEPQPLLIVA